MLTTEKDGGDRLCVDFQNLNHSIIWPTIQPGMKFFTVIDALKGYDQVQLAEESAALKTFSTPFGRHQYPRLPFGKTHAGEHYRVVSPMF